MSGKRTRSRFGCHRCKSLKVKCDELKPSCSLCQKTESKCDYSIKLTWGGRPFKKQKANNLAFGTISSYQKKYNSDQNFKAEIQFHNHDPSKPTPKKSTKKQEPHPVQVKIETSSPPLLKDKPATPQYPDSDLKSVNLINPKPSTNPDSALSHNFPLFDGPHVIPHLISTPAFTQLDRFVQQIDHEPQRDNGLLKAFQDIETSNLSIKRFVNDIVIPDLSLNFINCPSPSGNITHEELKEHNKRYNTSSNDIYPLSSDSESPPDHLLVFSENFMANPVDLSSDFSTFDLVTQNILDFDTIPLSISPLPDILLQNDYYRKHYHFYIEVFSKILYPAPPQTYRDNPFTCILPKMSLSSGTDGLLSLLIASSAAHSCQLNGEPFPEKIIKELTNRALNDLYNHLIDPVEANSDYTLALVLLLSCFEMICAGKRPPNGWRAHYHGAKKIIFSKGYLKANELNKNQDNSLEPSSSFEEDHDINESLVKVVDLPEGKESDLHFFFSRWFVYLDVIGSLASSSEVYRRAPSDTASITNEAVIWKGPPSVSSDRQNMQDIDLFMGFDLRLLEYFSEIINISRECSLEEKSVDQNLDISMVQRALELKENMIKYLNETEVERDKILVGLSTNTGVKSTSIRDYEVLRATNKVFVLAGVLQIYRRILKLPKDSSLVQLIIDQITELISEKIPDNAPAAYCCVFALLSAGCDSISKKYQDFYLGRFTTLLKNGLNSAKVAIEIMVDSWNSKKYWAEVLSDKNIDVIFV